MHALTHTHTRARESFRHVYLQRVQLCGHWRNTILLICAKSWPVRQSLSIPKNKAKYVCDRHSSALFEDNNIDIGLSPVITKKLNIVTFAWCTLSAWRIAFFFFFFAAVVLTPYLLFGTHTRARILREIRNQWISLFCCCRRSISLSGVLIFPATHSSNAANWSIAKCNLQFFFCLTFTRLTCDRKQSLYYRILKYRNWSIEIAWRQCF